jgi:hypothetical protein
MSNLVATACDNSRPHSCLDELLQPRVLGFGLLQDGDVGVGVFPESEKIFVGGECTDAGGIGICSCEVLACKAFARATASSVSSATAFAGS